VRVFFCERTASAEDSHPPVEPPTGSGLGFFSVAVTVAVAMPNDPG